MDEVYVFFEPKEEKLPWRSHFWSLSTSSGDRITTLMEFGFLVALTATSLLLPSTTSNVTGSMRLFQLSAFLWAFSLLRRVYNSYLEAVYFAFPNLRTQATKKKDEDRDLNGRDRQQLQVLVMQDRYTLIMYNTLSLCLYYGIPGFYPPVDSPLTKHSLFIRAIRLVTHHYLLSFGMYWLHRSLHANSFLWHRIHCIHHWARHPLSRNTYQDHWLDNFGNAIVGEVAAQIILPLDFYSFWCSRLFRAMEGLEKHSGVSGQVNLTYSLQQWIIPYAQMPHHHDWHHEKGRLGRNFAFSSIGGMWDCLFGTREAGRAMEVSAATAHDKKSSTTASDHCHRNLLVDRRPELALVPVVAILVVATAKLLACSFRLCDV